MKNENGENSMFEQTIQNLEAELEEIIDRIESAAKDKSINQTQRIDVIVARDLIWNGLNKLKECL